DRIDPVLQMQQLAVGSVVEIAATRSRAEDHLLRLLLEPRLGDQLEAAAVDVERCLRAHEGDHGAAVGVAESAFEIDLEVAGSIGAWLTTAIHKQGLDRIGGLPDALGRVEAAHADGPD